jgi:hypothetical protein
MPKVKSLNANEELFWRALMRIVLTLPRHLDRDMVQAVGMTANEYTTVMNLSEAPNRENRLAMTSDLLIALFMGLSVPVVGAGIALNQGASAPNTVLGFAILVGLGVSVSGWALLGRRPKDSGQAS